jgi:hypothetical protein
MQKGKRKFLYSCWILGMQVSNNDKEFIRTSLRTGDRVDGRRPFDYRSIRIDFGEKSLI